MRRLTRRSRAVAAALAAAAAGASCAQPSAPPGGPPDPMPPVVVSISPDSGEIGGRPEEVVFRFDEVVSERPARGTSLDQLVLISPREGGPRVRWRRDAITVRPSRGFRDSTVYVVQLLPGVVDLRGNTLDSTSVTVFSTGGPIPATRVTGVVFDWVAQRGVPEALVQAITRPDSVVYVTRADSSGRFVLPFVPPGAITVVGAADGNRNFAVDEREAWDSTAVTLADSTRLELYAFVHDTVGPAVRDVTVRDSVTLRLTLDRPLATDQAVDTALVAILTADSAAVALAGARAITGRDTALTAPRDSAAAADTAAAPVSIRPPADTAADTTRREPPPVPTRPAPVSEIEVRTARPLTAGARYIVELREARNLLGFPRTSQRSFEVPRPDTTARDTSATRDTTARDTTATRDTTARDTTATRDTTGVVPPPVPPPATPPPDAPAGDRPAAPIGEPPRALRPRR